MADENDSTSSDEPSRPHILYCQIQSVSAYIVVKHSLDAVVVQEAVHMRTHDDDYRRSVVPGSPQWHGVQE
jgi:hypothetical protein